MTNDEVLVIMDYFTGRWTPFAVFPTLTEAKTLQESLSDEAPVECVAAPYYGTENGVRDAVLDTIPDPQRTTPPGELVIVFDEKTVHGAAPSDQVGQALNRKTGGKRGPCPYYETAEKAVVNRPEADGAFISAEKVAGDFFDHIN